MTELEAFILLLDQEIQKGQRAEQALRTVVTELAKSIRKRVNHEVDRESFGN